MSSVRRIGEKNDVRELQIMRGRAFGPIQAGSVDFDSCAREGAEAGSGLDDWNHLMRIKIFARTWPPTKPIDKCRTIREIEDIDPDRCRETARELCRVYDSDRTAAQIKRNHAHEWTVIS